MIVAPGDAQQALFWSEIAMNMAWKFQIPAFILSDKTLSEGTYSINPAAVSDVQRGDSPGWAGTVPYLRYADVPSGISPLAFPGMKDAVIKVNSYAHDEAGITSEEAGVVEQMTKKTAAQVGMVNSGNAGISRCHPFRKSRMLPQHCSAGDPPWVSVMKLQRFSDCG